MRANSPNLDFIRTVAVSAVVVRHLFGVFDVASIGPFRVQLLGIFGVMLFFVHTAHVLMFSLERLQAERRTGVAWRFLVRRAFRIYPLSMLVVAIGFALTAWRDVPGFATLSAANAAANMMLVQNLTGSPDAIGTLWSLPLEVQMYLFLPAVFLLARTSVAATGAVYGIALALGLAAFKLHLPDVARYFPCFVPGVVAYGLIARGARQTIPFVVLPAVLALAWCLYAALGGWSQTVGAYPACLLVGLAIPYARDCGLRWLNTACETVAKYSYGIYLVHAPALALSFALPAPVAVKLAVFVASTTGLSVLAYRFIEDPMVQAGKVVTRLAPVAEMA